MTSSHAQRISLLINSLISKTRSTGADRVSWETTDGDRYELTLTNTTIAISTRDGDGDAPYQFEIIDGGGRTIELLQYESTTYDHEQLSSLYEAVSINSSGVDEKLGEIFNELGIEEPPF